LNSSANRIHWVVPETDESGKKVAPTPWVQHYLHQWNETSPWMPIPRGPLEQALYLYSLDSKAGALLPPEYAALLGIHTVADAIPGEDEAGRHGLIASAAFSKESHPGRLSVTELELLAQCPYRFYAHSVAGWRTVRPLMFAAEPDALQWGGLVHSYFEQFLSPCRIEGTALKDLQSDSEEVPWRDLKRIVDQLPARYRLLPGPLKVALARRISTAVEAYMKAVQGNICQDGVVLDQEVKIRLPFPGRGYLTVSGQIDRVDNRHGRCHIVDYKSGQKPWNSRKERELALGLGYQLQPGLYTWLYRVHRDLTYTPSFSFIFLGCDPPQEDMIPGSTDLEGLLLSLVSLLEKGLFIPTSQELMTEWGFRTSNPCRYCELNSLCRRFDPDARSCNGTLFETLAEERFAAMTGQLRKGCACA